MLIKCCNVTELQCYNNDLIKFEKQFSYPTQNASFYITHQNNYGNFFQSLRYNIDEPLFFIALDSEDKVLGIAVVCLQSIPSDKGKINVWYLCDLKISNHIRSSFVLVKLLKTIKEKCYSICQNIYGISMNQGSENKIAKFAKHNPFLNLTNCDTFKINSIETIEEISKIKSYYPNSFLDNLTDKKTIVVNGNPIQLYHIVQLDVQSNRISLNNTLACNEIMQKSNNSNTLVLFADHNSIIPKTPWGSCSIIHTNLPCTSWEWLDTSII